MFAAGSCLRARRERRSKEGKQRKTSRAFVGHAQLFVTPIEREGSRAERNPAVVHMKNTLTFHREQHEIRLAMAMRRQILARTEPNDPNVGPRALDERHCHRTVAVEPRGVPQTRDLHHHHSIAHPPRRTDVVDPAIRR